MHSRSTSHLLNSIRRLGFTAALAGFAVAAASAATTSSSATFNFNDSGSVSTGLVALASTISNSSTTNCPTLTLPEFNSALGTLTEVDVAFATTTSTFDVHSTGLLSLISSGTAALALDYTITSGTTTRSGGASSSTAGAALVELLGGSPTAIASPALSAAQNTATFTAASDLAAFTGSGNVDVALSAVDAFSVTTLASIFDGAGFAGSGTYAGTVTVTYTYTPVPVAVAPTISSQPTSVSANEGASVTFSVSASGSGTLSYQWTKNAIAISGATGSSLTLNNVQPSDAASYGVTVTNSAGSVSSSLATLTVMFQTPAPVIGTQPAAQSATVGSAVTFSVGATGTGLSYQWLDNGAAIAGATGSSFTIASVQLSDAGSYTVAITNAGGTVTSAAAVLSVTPAVTTPVFSTVPAAAEVPVGGSVTFSALATGTGVSYQWLDNGTAIAGATNSTLTLSNVQVSAAGNYSVTASNSAGSVTSPSVALTVDAAASSGSGTSGSSSGGTGSTDGTSSSGTGTSSSGSSSGGTSSGSTGSTGSSGSTGSTGSTTGIGSTGTGTSSSGSSSAGSSSGSTSSGSTGSAGASGSTGGTSSNTGTGSTGNGTSPSGSSSTGSSSGSSSSGSTGSTSSSSSTDGTGSTNGTLSSGSSTSSTGNGSSSGSTDSSSSTGGSSTNTSSTVTTVTFSSQPRSQSVNAGSPVTFSCATANASPTYQWYKDGTAIAGATSSTYTIAAVQPSDAADYTVAAWSGGVSATSSDSYLVVVGGTLTDSTGGDGPLMNISSRAVAGSGSNALVAGFVSWGQHQVLLRGIGPGLTQFGITGALANPQLRLYRGTAALAENDNWEVGNDITALSAAMARVGAFALPVGSADDAMIVTVPDGPYSIQVSSPDGSTGVALIEVYLLQ